MNPTFKKKLCMQKNLACLRKRYRLLQSRNNALQSEYQNKELKSTLIMEGFHDLKEEGSQAQENNLILAQIQEANEALEIIRQQYGMDLESEGSEVHSINMVQSTFTDKDLPNAFQFSRFSDDDFDSSDESENDEKTQNAIDKFSKHLVKEKSSVSLNTKIQNNDILRQFKKQEHLKQQNLEWSKRWENLLKQEPFTQGDDQHMISCNIVQTNACKNHFKDEMDPSMKFLEHLKNINNIRKELQNSKSKPLEDFKFPKYDSTIPLRSNERNQEFNNQKCITRNNKFKIFLSSSVDRQSEKEKGLFNYFQRLDEYYANKERSQLENEIVEKVNQMLMDTTSKILSEKLNYMEIVSQKMFFLSELHFMQKKESSKFEHYIGQLYTLMEKVNEQINTRKKHYNQCQDKLTQMNEDIKIVQNYININKDKKTNSENDSALLLSLLETRKLKLAQRHNKTRNALGILNNYLVQLTREYNKNQERITDIEKRSEQKLFTYHFPSIILKSQVKLSHGQIYGSNTGHSNLLLLEEDRLEELENQLEKLHQEKLIQNNNKREKTKLKKSLAMSCSKISKNINEMESLVKDELTQLFGGNFSLSNLEKIEISPAIEKNAEIFRTNEVNYICEIDNIQKEIKEIKAESVKEC